MEPGIPEVAATRSVTKQLADDFLWLENHAKQQGAVPASAGELRLGSASLRNVIAPFLESQPALPLHVALVGGAGAGKSTVANLLCGTVQAEANPQAGFTRHPIVFVNANLQLTWPGSLGFLGSLQLLNRVEPASLDADVYQIRRLHPDPEQFSVLDRFVVWDCPDMTTWAASNYVPRLLEVAGLADVIVYVASDERYNDEIPTQFLRLLLQAGKPVIVCLTKMKPADAPAFVAHFQKEVLGKMPRQAVAILTIPHLTPEQRLDPIRLAAAYRVPLVNQVTVLGEPPGKARNRNVLAVILGLQQRQDALLKHAKGELEALEGWRQLVQQGQLEFESRYQREFLTSARFRRFDEALVRLLELLELPGIGKYLSTTLYVLRTPYRLAKGLFNRALFRPESPGLPEKRVLTEAMNGWLDLLRKEGSTQAETHPLWALLLRGFNGDLPEKARAKFEESVRGFQLGLEGEVERTAQAIYEDLEKNPVALNTLRGTKVSLEVAAIGGTVMAAGFNAMDLLLIPLATSVMGFLIDLLGKQYVDFQREQTRRRQEAMVKEFVTGPIKDWLIAWPTTGGSEYEQLQAIVQRVPQNLQQLETIVRSRVQ